MTTRMLLGIIARRWYIILLGMVAAGAAFLMLHSDGAYTTQARVAFIGPGISQVGQTNDGQLETLTAFAAAVEREYHDGKGSDRLAENATLYGAGITQGVEVLLPNTGGQWQMSFANAVIDVTVVGPTPAWVLAHRDAAIARIQDIARTRQHAAAVTDQNMITSLVIPASQVGRYGPTRSTQARAGGILLLVGVSLSTGAAALLDGALSRRRHRRTLPVRPALRAAQPARGTP